MHKNIIKQQNEKNKKIKTKHITTNLHSILLFEKDIFQQTTE